MEFQELYILLFRSTEKAVRAIDAKNYGLAKEILISAQQKAEETYLNQKD